MPQRVTDLRGTPLALAIGKLVLGEEKVNPSLPGGFLTGTLCLSHTTGFSGGV